MGGIRHSQIVKKAQIWDVLPPIQAAGFFRRHVPHSSRDRHKGDVPLRQYNDGPPTGEDLAKAVKKIKKTVLTMDKGSKSRSPSHGSRDPRPTWAHGPIANMLAPAVCDVETRGFADASSTWAIALGERIGRGINTMQKNTF